MNLLQHLCCICIHFFMIHHSNRTNLFGRIPSYENIFSDTSFRNRLKLLMNHSDSAVKSIQRPFNLYLFSLVNDFPFVHVVDTKHALHQGGLSGTIFSHQSMYRSRTQLKLCTIQRLYAWKCLYDIMHFQTII